MKERLVGAAVLVAIAVIVIPMILGGHQHKHTADQKTPLPGAQKAPHQEYRMDLVSNSPATLTRPAPAPNAPVHRQQTPAPPADETVASSRSTTASTEHASEPPASSREGAVAENAPSASKPAPGPATAAPPSGGWAVQAGSFSKQDNARDVMSALKHKGYHAFISAHRLGGDVFYRVRVGPVPNRTRAEALAPQVGKAYGGQVAVVSNQ
jgi:DedD protein